MATWSDVELLTNEDTNTVRLGGVSKEENGSGLYQVDTLVKISTASETDPRLSSSSGSNWNIVVADKTVILFDQSYQAILLLLHFETNVDAIDVCMEGQFLVVCERNGNLNLVYVPTRKILLTTMVVVENLLYILDTEDALSLWDLHFLVMIHCWQDLSIHDFELTTECGSASMVSYVSVLSRVLSCKYTEERASIKQGRKCKCMCMCYSQDKGSMKMITLTKQDKSQPVSAVVVRCFTEALPENRLSRLLHKHMFEEAEKFAITFELDLELVYKVKLDFVLEQLASASVGGYGQDVWSELVEEAKTNLMKITDEQYVVEYCLKAPWPTFETAEKILSHAATRYSSLQIQEALARLATFCSLHGPDNFNGIAWIEFLNSSDNLGEILTYLREGDMKGAQLIWLRYESKLEAVLGAIPEDLPSQDLCPWLRAVFVPFVRRVLPAGQKILARWLEQRTRNLELTEKAAWPQNGLDMAVVGLPSLWTWLKSDDNYDAEEVENLKSLVSNLRRLLDLQQKYDCRLSLSVFEKGSVRSVAFFMLDKVPAPELIATTVESSVLPYAEEHEIPLDELLLQYIKDLLERCSSQTTTLFTEWEAKAVAVQACMTDTDLMVDAVLEIMQKAVVPWSNVVEKLVQQYLEMDGPKQGLLKESYCLMEIRKLLRGYGIRNFNLSNSTQTMTLIRYILKQDLPMSLQDSLTLAEVWSLSSEEAECVIKRLTSWARLQLEDKHKKHQMVIAQVMVEALKYLYTIQKHDALKSMECENNLIMFKAIASLQEDFDVFFNPSNYEDPNIRKQIQEHHITAYENTHGRRSSQGKTTPTPVVANDPDGKIKTISTEAGLRRLGRQLQRTEQELWSDLALRALGVGKVDKALKILSELYEHHYNTCTGKVLYTAAKTLCQMLEADVPMVLPEDMDLPAVIHDLACQAIATCHADLLLDCLELCKCTRIAMDVYHQCQLSDNYGFIAKTEKDPRSQWSFQDVFTEDCIVLDPVSVLPVQYEITNCLTHLADTKLHPLDCSCLAHCSFEDGSNYLRPLLGPLTNMLQMLQECSQLELALRVLVNSYGSCLQHVTSNVMDIKLSESAETDILRWHLPICCALVLFQITLSISYRLQVFNWRVVDCDLAIGLCTLLSKAEVFKILWKVIDNTWQNYDKILAVARIGADLCCLYGEAEEQEKFLSVITDAEWGIKLGKMEISIQPVFRQRPEMKSSLIPDLVKNRRITPDIILQYCSTFGLDPDSVINRYITTLLLLQEDEEAAGDPETQPLCHANALERVLQIIPMLHNTSELTDSLCAAIYKLSPYNYERIEVVLKIIAAADENTSNQCICQQAMGLLQHLKSYKRVSPASDVENTYLLENSQLPNRLSNRNKCFSVSLDKLYMAAANHVFEKKMKPLLLEQRKKGRGHGSNGETFRVAKTMMKYIQCIQCPEWAAATAHKITQELPPGPEKTQSLRFCLALGDAWLRDPKLEVRETFLSKLKLQFQRSATENILITSQLNSPEHLKLTGLPARLIVALYEHSGVEQRYRESGGQIYPDIHAVVKEIACINNVDLLKIRNMMLEKWICKTGATVPKVGPNELTSFSELCSLHVLRVVYMLQSCPMEDPLSASGPRLTFCHRTRALLCLVRLADSKAFMFLYFVLPCRCYLRCYIFVSQLEALNIPYTVQSFLSSPKEGLVKGLWKNHSHEPQAVRLVADLCLEYRVYDPQLWNSLLQKLLGFNLVRGRAPENLPLKKIIDRLIVCWLFSFHPECFSLSDLSFLTASVPLSPDQQNVLLSSRLIQTSCHTFFFPRCPFLLNLDLVGIANRFAQFNLPAFALGTLLLIPCANKKAQQIHGFLSVCNPVAVLEQVEELMNTGELAGVPSQVRETVLTFVSQSGQHQKLLKTKHFKHLKQLIVSSGRLNQVKELVEYLISQNW
uniref:Kinetochore associated 1 n=1 Tax=Gasterosteus aculeatus aculeatus TaxID=481459 RepID=A0AAQ4R031_GASAC